MNDDSSELFSSLLNAFGAEPPVRIVPLIVERGYRGDTVARREVRYQRRVSCTQCKGATCELCSWVGWIVHAQTLDVTIPASSTAGTKLRCCAMGDAVGRIVGDLWVELCEEGERATELARLQEVHEAELWTKWRASRAGRRQERKKAWMALAGLSLFVALVAGAWAREHFALARLGESCVSDRDCRSKQCLTLLAPPARNDVVGVARTVGHVCSEECTLDADCPSPMQCVAISHGVIPQLALDWPADGMMCAPRP